MTLLSLFKNKKIKSLEELIREKNLLMLKLPINKQKEAEERWQREYKYYESIAIKTEDFFQRDNYEFANRGLRAYSRKK